MKYNCVNLTSISGVGVSYSIIVWPFASLGKMLNFVIKVWHRSKWFSRKLFRVRSGNRDNSLVKLITTWFLFNWISPGNVMVGGDPKVCEVDNGMVIFKYGSWIGCWSNVWMVYWLCDFFVWFCLYNYKYIVTCNLELTMTELSISTLRL